MTRAVSIRLALQTAILAALPLAALASDMGTSVPGYEAKLSFCQDCHGVEGQGFLGWYTIPRLANQQPEYILNQLKAFVTKNRENNIAIPMYRVHNAAPELGRALAAHFNKLNPPPAGGAPAGLAEKGKKIFEGGDPITISLLVLSVTVRRGRVQGKTRASQDSATPMWSTNCGTGAPNAISGIRLKPLPPWRPSRPH